MSKNKHAKRVKARVFVAPVVGDPGPPLLKAQYVHSSPEVDLDSVSTRALMNLALSRGIDVKEVCGIEKCIEHKGMRPLGEMFHQSKDYTKYIPGMDLLWCRQCWQWVREKKPLDLGEEW